MKKISFSFVILLFLFDAAFAQTARADLTALSLEALMNVEIYSAAKKPQRMLEAPAAIYVITADDIRRSGATTIPRILRMVPGVSVQKVNSHSWDISARGFNGSIFANKLLVLIDGRAVYTPLYGGVLWEVQDVVMEDIERVEVIRGPGGTLWGANAVNGVVNIITKKAKDTQGTLISAGGGSEERLFGTVRYGAKAQDWHYRTYAKYADRDEGYRTTGTARDEWDIGSTGFRAEKEEWNVQGDFYEANMGQRVNQVNFVAPYLYTVDKPGEMRGWNLLAKHEQEDWYAQMYWDATDKDFRTFAERRDKIDFEYLKHFDATANQEISYGFGYRIEMEEVHNTSSIALAEPDHFDQIFSVLLQDEIKMTDQLTFTLGSKLEHNIYTGLEVQPNARLLYNINERNSLWTAVSRAVRTPSRIETDADLTGYTPGFGHIRTLPSEDLSSEELIAYEAGYRTQPHDKIFLDLAVFSNHYDDLITFAQGGFITDQGLPVLTFPTVNGMSGQVNGVELATDIKILEWWKVKGSYSFSKMHLQTDNDVADIGLANSLETGFPQHNAYVRSSFDLPHGFELDAAIFYTDPFANGRVPASTQMDINLIKTFQGGWEVAVVAQNLTRSYHIESGAVGNRTQIERGGYVKVTRKF